MENMIDCVIVDTSVLDKYLCDFIGVFSDVLPSFYKLLNDKDITILNHPVLNSEVEKHINSSEIIEKAKGLKKSIARYKNIFALLNMSIDELSNDIDSLDLLNKLVEEYRNIYKNSIMLSYPSSESVFKKYFQNEAPFGNKDKKSEFPDAFILESIKEYHNSNPDFHILVISDDGDWYKSLYKINCISIINSIEKAIKILQTGDRIKPLFNFAREEITADIVSNAQYECYDLYEWEVEEDVEIESINSCKINDDFVVLSIFDTYAIIRTTATLYLNGSAVIFDYENSIWDSEDRTYILSRYAEIDFNNGFAEISVEFKLVYFDDEDDDTVSVEDLKIIAPYNIEIDLSDAIVDKNEMEDERDYMDYLAEQDESLEEYYKH